MRNLRHYWPALFVLVLGLSGCTGTRSAYQSAETLDAYAYVVGEHYAAVLHEAANISENPQVSEGIKARLREADNEVRPLVLALRPLAESYAATRSAEDEVELQQALNEAIVALHNFIQLVKRSEP